MATSAAATNLTLVTYSHALGACRRDSSPVDVDSLLRACESVLRAAPAGSIIAHTAAASYLTKLKDLFATEPLTLYAAVAEPTAATTDDAITVLSVAVIRRYQNTFNGHKFHIELMCTDPAHRSRGIGHFLMNELKSVVNETNGIVCQVDTLLQPATRFFSKEKMIIQCFSFIGSAESRGHFQPRALAASSPTASSPTSLASPDSAASSSPPPPASATPAFTVHHVTDRECKLTPQGAQLLAAAESVHRQLRPLLPPGEGYSKRMLEVFATGGRMLVAVQTPSVDDPTADSALPVILGVCVYRFYVDLVSGHRNWVDDLVTHATQRSFGVGHAMMEGVREETRAHGITNVQLDSGVQRRDAHRFYYREGLVIDAYSFHVSV